MKSMSRHHKYRGFRRNILNYCWHKGMSLENSLLKNWPGPYRFYNLWDVTGRMYSDSRFTGKLNFVCSSRVHVILLGFYSYGHIWIRTVFGLLSWNRIFINRNIVNIKVSEKKIDWFLSLLLEVPKLLLSNMLWSCSLI